MQPENRLHPLQSARLDHLESSLVRLFSRLEDALPPYRPGESVVGGLQPEQSPDDRRRVRVVPAGVHDAGHLTVILDRLPILDPQGVQVGAQGDAPAASNRLPLDNQSATFRSAASLQAPFCEHIPHVPGRFVLLTAGLRVRVQVPANGDHLRERCVDRPIQVGCPGSFHFSGFPP
jgi:hypothetical protein